MKPEKHEKKEKTHGQKEKKMKHGKTLTDWTAKGWSSEQIAAGESDSQQIVYDNATMHVELFGQVFDAEGDKIVGRNKPHVSVEENDAGAILTLSRPAIEDITVLYKVVTDEEEDEDGGEEETQTLI